VSRKIKPQLEGVPETLLWTLYHRALEARRPDAILHDPKAIELVERIDYPFEQRLGDGAHGAAQAQALRSLSFDREVRRFLSRYPAASIVALGAGLETQFHRVDNGRAHWLAVDLPEIAALRRQLLPESERERVIGCSVLDPRWMDEVDPSRPVLVTAQGLLMYLQPQQARQVLLGCARRFSEGELLFDAIPRWLSIITGLGLLKISKDFPVPSMPWALPKAERAWLRSLDAHVVEVSDVEVPSGRGLFYARLLPWMYRVPGLKRQIPPLTVRIVLGRAGR
jgi:O-methyltransferase involved in polyketide biosynthesis